MALSTKQKTILIFATVAVLAVLITGVIASVAVPSTVHVPAGTTKTDSFTVTATLNGSPVDPTNINVPSGFVGDTDTIIYTVTSTANQPILINANTNSGTLDKTSATLASNGAATTFTLTVTLTASPQTVTVNFS
jgi:hypothetical protein